MLRGASSSGREESGFWLYYRLSDKHYYIGQVKYGKEASGTGASMNLGSSLPEANGVPFDCVAIAPCHTHTSVEHETGEIERKPGVSNEDMKMLEDMSDDTYGYVVDYDTTHEVPAGEGSGIPIAIYVYNRNGEVAKYPKN
jgi:hypothetical protein